MKALVLLVFSLVLVVSPAAAQPTTPAPYTSTVVSEVADVTQTLGIVTVVILFVLAVLAGIVVFFVLVAWRLGIPLVGAIQKATDSAQKATEARDELQNKLFERLESGDRERAKTAELNERTAGILSAMETSEQAKQGRVSAVKAVNEHTDEDLKPITAKLDQVIQLLNDEEKDRAARDETMNLTIAEATRELMALKQTVQRLSDTGGLNPAHLPEADPATFPKDAPHETP